MNVKVKKFNEARVNGGSNYDSLKGLAVSDCCFRWSPGMCDGLGATRSPGDEENHDPARSISL
eukprot:superscaffoldBa00015948_g26733